MKKVLIIVCFLGTVIAALADERSSVDGFVTADIARSSLAGATVGIDSLSKEFHRDTVANAAGYYVLDDLRPGTYSMWAEVRGMGCILYPHVSLLSGKRLRQDFRFARSRKDPGGCQPIEKKTFR